MSARPAPGFENVTGYQVVLGASVISLHGGDSEPFDVNVKATPLLNAQDFAFDLVADYTHSASGYNQTVVVRFVAQVNPYDFAVLTFASGQSQKAGQDDVVIFPVAIQNTGVYPDTYKFTISAKPDLLVTVPSTVYVGPGETRIVNVSVLTPHSKLYEFSRSETIGIKINSLGVAGIGGTGVYSAFAILQIRGAYIPVYWIPLFLVGFVSMGVVIRGARDKGSARSSNAAPRALSTSRRARRSSSPRCAAATRTRTRRSARRSRPCTRSAARITARTARSASRPTAPRRSRRRPSSSPHARNARPTAKRRAEGGRRREGREGRGEAPREEGKGAGQEAQGAPEGAGQAGEDRRQGRREAGGARRQAGHQGRSCRKEGREGSAKGREEEAVRPSMRTFALAAVILFLLSSGCVIGRDPLIIAVSAPKSQSAMTLFLVTEGGPLDRYRDLSAEYEIHFGDRLIYPPAGRGATFLVDGRTGTVEIPYDLFVVGNGEYDVIVRYAGEQTRSRVSVEKWVEHVWLRPFERGDAIVVEVALSSATGGRPDDRILAHGELILTIRYRGPQGDQDRVVGQVSAETRHDRTATPIAVSKTRLSQGAGYYSFEPLFHNLEARDNVQVEGDPTMANLRPPWNWIYVSE